MGQVYCFGRVRLFCACFGVKMGDCGMVAGARMRICGKNGVLSVLSVMVDDTGVRDCGLRGLSYLALASCGVPWRGDLLAYSSVLI